MSRADRGDDVWAQFIESYYGEMITDLNKGDTKSLLSYLTALPRKGAGHGYLQGEELLGHYNTTLRARLKEPCGSWTT